MEKTAIERIDYRNDISIKLVVPSECNASCPFCYCSKGHQSKAHYDQSAVDHFLSNYIRSIDHLLDKIDGRHPVSIDITGGEPTFNIPLLAEILRGLKMSGITERVDRVVMTTNGYNLLDAIPYLEGTVNYINISLHDHRSEERNKILGFLKADDELHEIVSRLKSIGIKASAVSVIHKPINDFRTWMYDFIRWCKGIGFIALRFRCDVFWNKQQQFDYYMSRTEKDPWFKVIDGGNAPDSLWRRLRGEDGFRVFFLHGVADTSIISPGVEYIVADDGQAYADYYKRTPIEHYKYPIGKVFDLIT